MQSNGFVRELIEYVVTFLVVLVIMLGVRHFIVAPFQVDGRSMDYTLMDQERLFMWRRGSLDHFDVITFHPPHKEDTLYVKRIIGLPGDTIEYKDDTLYLNGQAVDEPYLDQKKTETEGNFTQDFTLEELTGEQTVPDGMMFVLGDNRRNSVDSRNFGFVFQDAFEGRAFFKFWPLSHMGKLTNYGLNEEGQLVVD